MLWIFEFNPSVTALVMVMFQIRQQIVQVTLEHVRHFHTGWSRLRLTQPNQSLKNLRAQPSS